MNARERFHATMHFEPLDRPLYWEFGYWVPTLRRWYDEGLPCRTGISDSLGDDGTVTGELGGVHWRNPHLERDVHDTLGFDEHVYRIPIKNVFCPEFESEILEDRDEWYTVTDVDGIISQVSKINGSRHFVEFPVKTRADYERLREERLQPNLEERLPDNWPEVRGVIVN